MEITSAHSDFTISIFRYMKSRPALSITLTNVLHDSLHSVLSSIPAIHQEELTRFDSSVASDPPRWQSVKVSSGRKHLPECIYLSRDILSNMLCSTKCSVLPTAQNGSQNINIDLLTGSAKNLPLLLFTWRFSHEASNTYTLNIPSVKVCMGRSVMQYNDHGTKLWVDHVYPFGCLF